MQPNTKKRLTREEVKQQTRKNLLEAAITVFGQKGFHGASIDDIAEAAGYTKGAVYTHFASKDELYLALLDENLKQEDLVWTQLLEEGKLVGESIEEIQKEVLNQLNTQKNWGILTLEFFVYALRHPQVKEKLTQRIYQGIASYRQSLEKRYNHMKKQPPMDLDDLAKTLMVFDNSFAILGLLDEPETFISLYPKVMSTLLD